MLVVMKWRGFFMACIPTDFFETYKIEKSVTAIKQLKKTTASYQ